MSLLSRPAFALASIRLSSVSPGGTGNSGRWCSPSFISKLHLSAISIVLDIASGISLNASHISCGDFTYSSSVANFILFGVFTVFPVCMQSSMSCTLASSFLR